MKEKTFFRNISEFLGPKENRYFSNGYKAMEIFYEDITQIDESLITSIQVMTGSSWSKKNGKNMVPHLGTTEIISISAIMSQHLLERQMHLNSDEIERAWISRFKCKIRQRTDINQNQIPVSGKIILTESFNDFFQSQILVQIGTLRVTLYVCHPPAGSSNSSIKDTGSINLYYKGYKLRDHSINDVVLDSVNKTSSGTVTLYEANVKKNGIGAGYPGMMLTDFILVSGQLAQALLCNINGNIRENSNNMWLREVDILSEIPPKEKISKSEVTFQNVDNVEVDNETWQYVIMTCSLCNMFLRAKLAQKYK